MNCPDAAVIMVLYRINYRQQNQQVQALINLCKLHKKMISQFVEPLGSIDISCCFDKPPQIYIFSKTDETSSKTLIKYNSFSVAANLQILMVFSCVNKQGGTGSNSEFIFSSYFSGKGVSYKSKYISASITKENTFQQ